jgi:hypothetical protein
MDKTEMPSTNNEKKETDCEAFDRKHALHALHNLHVYVEDDEIDRSQELEVRECQLRATTAPFTCNAFIDPRINGSNAASASSSDDVTHLSSTCTAAAPAVDLDPLRSLRCSRTPHSFSKKSLIKKMRSPVKPFEGDGVYFDQFDVPSVADRRLRQAFKLQACAWDDFGLQERRKTRKLLSTDIARAGTVLEEVIEVAARPRAVYNARLGSQIHLAMLARVYQEST